MASKGGKKIDQAELKKLIDEHRGKPVETVWGGGSKWSRIGFDRGVKGRIVGWGADGPQVEVDPEYRVWAACQKFFPGSRANPEKWGEGTTWRFTKAKKG